MSESLNSWKNEEVIRNDEWNLKGLFYKDLNDPKLEADFIVIENTFEAFAFKYQQNKRHLKNSKALRAALDDYQSSILGISYKPISYLSLLLELNSGNARASALYATYSNRLAESSNKLSFFTLEIGDITEDTQRKFSDSKNLGPYHYWLERLWIKSKHNLSEKEENILTATEFSRREKVILDSKEATHSKTVLHNGVEVPLTEAYDLIRDLDPQEAHLLYMAIKKAEDELAEIATTELNILARDKAVIDKMRGYDVDKPYSSTIENYQNDEETVMSLVDTVTDRFDISRRFYMVRDEALELDLFDSKANEDGKENLNTKTYTFDESVEILRSILGKADKRFLEIFNEMLLKGQISAKPAPGKNTGGFSTTSRNLPTMVLLNHTNDYRSLKTFAHEIGHAIHSSMSKDQPYIYQQYSTAAAEVASNFFEQLLFDEIFEDLSDEDKIIALNKKIGTDVNSVFGQIAYFNFETEKHNLVRKNGSVTKEELVALMRKAKASLFTEDDNLDVVGGNDFVNLPHLRSPFYVYTYAYGNLISRVLMENYKSDGDIEKVKKFLSAGSSMSPEDIFAESGVTVNEELFTKGLRKIKDDILLLEELVAKQKSKELALRELAIVEEQA